MSYLVLARKYRPADFAQLVGQEHVVQALSNALKTGRLHHAWLFTGTRGVGKTTVSRILAKSLNCEGPDGRGGITDAPCGVCPACREIDAGRFVDYTELDAASNRGVDEVQSLLEQAVYKPVQGRFKVFMIDEVHMLTGHAFNAMLKTLEEPPEYLKFVLATTDPQKVPVTVLSRCLQFNLRPIAPQTVRAHLARVLASENIEADSAALALIARAARGSMRDALSLADQAIAFSAGRLEEGAVRQMLGSADRGHVVRLIDALARGDGRGVLDVVAALREHGLSAGATLEDMSELLQRMAVRQAVPDTATPGPQPQDDDEAMIDSDAAQIERLAALMPADETQLLYSICVHGRAELGLAPDEYSGLTMVLLRLLAFKPAAAEGAAPAGKKTPLPHEQREIVDSDARVEPQSTSQDAGASQKPEYETKPRSAAAPAAPEPTPAEIHSRADAEHDAFWHETVQRLVAEDRIAALVRELALQSQLVARDPGRWLLRVESASLNQPAARERLALARAAAGHEVAALEIETAAVTDSPARRNAAAADAAQREAERRIRDDPFVQSMMREFGARIVPGSVKPVRAPAQDAGGSMMDNPALNS